MLYCCHNCICDVVTIFLPDEVCSPTKLCWEADSGFWVQLQQPFGFLKCAFNVGRFLESHSGHIFNVLIRGDLRTVGCKSQDRGLYWNRFVVVFQLIRKSWDVFYGKAYYFRRLSPRVWHLVSRLLAMETFLNFLRVLFSVSKILVSKKSLSIGLENIWSQKNVSVSVSKNFCSKKSQQRPKKNLFSKNSWYWSQKIWTW